MAYQNMRLSGPQIRRLLHETMKFAGQNNLGIEDVVITISGQNGEVVLTDYNWDKRELSGKHTDDTLQPKTVSGFNASV